MRLRHHRTNSRQITSALTNHRLETRQCAHPYLPLRGTTGQVAVDAVVAGLGDRELISGQGLQSAFLIVL